MEVSRFSSSVIAMLKKEVVSAQLRLFASALDKNAGSISEVDRNTRSAPNMLEACTCIEDCSLSPKNPTLDIEVTAKTIEKNSISKSPLKTSDQNFFKPYMRPLLIISALQRVHKLPYIFLLKINHELLELKLFELFHLVKIEGH